MKKEYPTVESKVSLPMSPIETSFKGNKNLTELRQIRETIIINSGAWVGIESKGLVRVNSTLYNLKYYELIGSDSTQKEILKKALKQLFPSPHISKSIEVPKPINRTNNSVDTELNQIVNIDKLIKKLIILGKHEDEAKKTKDKDKFILIGRKLKKEREAIDSLLCPLKQDNCFSIRDNYIHYQGQYANCKRLLPNGGF